MLKGLYEEAMGRMIDYYKTCLDAACNDLKCPKYYPASNSMSEVEGLGLFGAPLYTVMQHISAAVGKRNTGRIQQAICNELDSKRAEGITTPSNERILSTPSRLCWGLPMFGTHLARMFTTAR